MSHQRTCIFQGVDLTTGRHSKIKTDVSSQISGTTGNQSHDFKEGCQSESSQNVWLSIKNHPLTIITFAIITSSAITFETTRELRIVPLEKQIETVQAEVTELKAAVPKFESKSPFKQVPAKNIDNRAAIRQLEGRINDI